MTNKELVLVNPPNPCDLKGFSGGLLTLKLWAERYTPGLVTTILDEEFTEIGGLEKSIGEKISSTGERPYVGITATTASYQNSLKTARAIKRLRPNSTIVLGGHHTDGQEQVILDSHPEIDVVVRGEGERPLVDILNGDLTGPGITARGYRTLRLLDDVNKGIPLQGEELNSMTVDQFDQDYYFRSRQFEEQNLVTARGCPLQCAFCSVRNDGIRAQDPDKVIEQFDYIVDQLDRKGLPKIIAIQDNFFAQDRGRAREIAERLAEYRRNVRSDFEWNMQTRVEQFGTRDQEGPKLARLLKDAGCTAAYFGIENFDPNMLDVLTKARNSKNYVETAIRAIDNTLKAGIRPHIQFQAGIPGENSETEAINEGVLARIGEVAKPYNLNPLVFPSLSVVYPGTGFHERMIGLGAPRDAYEIFTEWEDRHPEQYRQVLGGYFAHGNGGIPLGVIDLNEFRDGNPAIDEKRLDRVKSYIDRLRAIDGITVHDFTRSTRE